METPLPIRPPIPLWPSIPWPVLVGLGLLLAVLLWLWWRARTRNRPVIEGPPPISAWEEARRALDACRALIPEADPGPFTVAVSGTLRRYLERRLEIPVQVMTTEEFLPLAAAHPNLKGSSAEYLRRFLERCDEVKFALQPMETGSRQELLVSAGEFLRLTESPLAEASAPPGADISGLPGEERAPS